MKPRTSLVFSLTTVCLLAPCVAAPGQDSDPTESPAPGQPFIQGPAIVGNGLPNGIGTTLGRLFVRVVGLEEGESDAGVPLEIPLTSSMLRVEPTTCAAASESPCASPGSGLAAVNGYPTVFATNFMHLKVGGAVYLPYDLPSGGSSFEIAFEGTINVGTNAPEDATCTVILAHSDMDRIRSWGAESTSDRPFDDNTGTGVIVADELVNTFNGRITGRVLKNDGRAVLVALSAAELRPGESLGGRELTLEPDFEAAAAAGLPEGAFLLIETNYSGLPSPSGVYPGAATNDVELVVTAKREARDFIRGDCNGDGDALHGLVDAIFLLQFNFLGGPEPPCLIACDADADGLVVGRLTDAIYLLTYAFLAGPYPPAPFPECGPPAPDETGELSCEYAICDS